MINNFEISHIIDNIYLGNIKGGNNYELLKEYNIQAIVRILNPENIRINRMNDLLREDDDNMKYLYISLYDHPSDNLIKYLDRFMDFMNNNKEKNILIHCMMGVSRSASFTILYLIKNYSMTLEDAIILTKCKRNIVNPNGGFLIQMKKYYENKEQ